MFATIGVRWRRISLLHVIDTEVDAKCHVNRFCPGMERGRGTWTYRVGCSDLVGDILLEDEASLGRPASSHGDLGDR